VVSLEILGPRGERVRRLLSLATQTAGERSWVWDGLDDHGSAAPAGVYLARLRVDGEDFVRRFPMIR